ncbi:MAG: glycoside hydrolase [Acetivibrionales bacterium]
MKRLVSVIPLIVPAILVITVILHNSSVVSSVFDPEIKKQSYYNKREMELFQFVECHVLGHEKERLTDVKNNSTVYTLSESVGIMMDYGILRGKIDTFNKEYQFLKNKLMVEDRFIKWKTGADINCNAAIDDFRIIRALLDAYEKWRNKKYFHRAGFIQDGIYSNQVINGNIYEFYDWKSEKAKPVIPLCYLDLYTMDRLRVFNKNWLAVADRGLTIIRGGRFKDNSPFFYKYYDFRTGSYQPDEQMKKNGGICLIYTLYTVIHLAEVNEDTGFFTDWLRNEIKKGKLYAWYNPYTLKPSDDMESTAVYALASVYCKKCGEDEMYDKLIDRMLDFMVTNNDSPYFGGFGNEANGEFYSFDNLTALWALGMNN